MSLGQVCDLAYALLVEDTVDQVSAIRHAWASSGSSDTPMPSLEEALENLNEALEHDATAGLTPEELELREVLGVGLK